MTVPKEFYNDQRYTVSTDIVGVFGNPEHSLEFWSQVFPPDSQLALELLRWKHLSSPSVNKIRPFIAGFHGRTGLDGQDRLRKDPLDTAKVTLLNMLLQDTLSISREVEEMEPVGIYPHALIYVLVHEMEANYILKKKIKLPSNTLLAVENHIGKNAVDKALRTAGMLRAEGYKVVDVFDIVHSMRSRPSKIFFFNWRKMLEELYHVGQCLVHLPIGINMEDSIDYDKVNGHMLKDLSEVIDENNSRVVVEHQTGGLPVIKLRPATRNYLLFRAQVIINDMFSHGVLKHVNQ